MATKLRGIFFCNSRLDHELTSDLTNRSNLILSAAPKSTRPRSARERSPPPMFRVYPASDTSFRCQQGKLYVRGDSKVFRFFNGKSESLFLQRKNPRRIAWTILFRRMHKKGISEVRLSPLSSFFRGSRCS